MEPANIHDQAGAEADCVMMTLRDARAACYRQRGFPEDGGIADRFWSPVKRIKTLPNFKWRRRALPIHDLHHVIAGYEFSPYGEFEMSAWEFAAGPYPNAWSTLFCLPLVTAGVTIIPRRTFKAFVRGRRSKTLYDASHVEALLDKSIAEVRRGCVPVEDVRATFRDIAAFAMLLFASLIVTVSPALLLSALWFLGR
jgi:hypothetical protein